VVLHAATVGVTCFCIYRLIDRGPESTGDDGRSATVHPGPAAIAAGVGALALAFSTAFWHYALVAEVFPLNSFFASILLLLLSEWERQPWRRWLFWAFALCSGLAATNQLTVVLLAPAFLVFLWSGSRRLWVRKKGRWRSPHGIGARHVLVAAVLVLVGLLPYAYLPLAASRHPPALWGEPSTLQTLLQHVTRAAYGSFSLALQDQPGGGSPFEQLVLLATYLFQSFTPIGCLLALAGGWWLARNRPIHGLATLLAFLFSGPLFVAYANPQIDTPIWKGVLERFYILPSIPFAVAVGAGAYQVLAWTQQVAHVAASARRSGKSGSLPVRFFGSLRRPPALVRYATLLVSLALLVFPVGSAVARFATVDQSDNFLPHQYGEDLFAPLDAGALLLTRGDIVTNTAWYLQYVEGYRRDLVTVDIELLKLPSYVQQMRRQHPDLVIPFDAYDEGRTNSLKTLVEANLATRPVYLLGQPKEKEFSSWFDQLPSGFAVRLMPRGSGGDLHGILREKMEQLKQVTYPSRIYPPTTYESDIDKTYGALAADLGYTLHVEGRVAEATALYRTAIRLAPDHAPPYKNLALLLDEGSDSAEVAGLLEQYLRLQPDDPDAAAIRAKVDRIRGQVP
jgi:tetratricopeptide (TPR) repeat protein